jgi:hypothetical protein
MECFYIYSIIRMSVLFVSFKKLLTQTYESLTNTSLFMGWSSI